MTIANNIEFHLEEIRHVLQQVKICIKCHIMCAACVYFFSYIGYMAATKYKSVDLFYQPWGRILMKQLLKSSRTTDLNADQLPIQEKKEKTHYENQD
ncbi:hypothetical protein EMCRGX_G027951 [Ephydatia muelleri]